MKLGKYSFGIGDRFGFQGSALLDAMIKAQKDGINICPVWNKSNREHTTIGTKPADVRKEADEAVNAAGWMENYYVDADHINLSNVDLFMDCCVVQLGKKGFHDSVFDLSVSSRS